MQGDDGMIVRNCGGILVFGDRRLGERVGNTGMDGGRWRCGGRGG